MTAEAARVMGMTPRAESGQAELAATLREQMRRWERQRRPDWRQTPENVVSSGSPVLDRLLTDGGFERGTLIEWLAASRGSGAATLALAIAARACGFIPESGVGSRESGASHRGSEIGDRESGSWDRSPQAPSSTPDSRLPTPDSSAPRPLVIIDRPKRFYPPVAARWGLAWPWCVVVRPMDDRDEAWAMDQALRSSGVGAVLAWPQKLPQRRFRQWQLAAEAGGTLGFLVRDERARREPSWAELRLLVTAVKESRERYEVSSASSLALRAGGAPLGPRRRLRVEILHARAGRGAGAVELQLDEQTGGLYEASAMALASRLAATAT